MGKMCLFLVLGGGFAKCNPSSLVMWKKRGWAQVFGMGEFVYARSGDYDSV